MYTRTTTSAPRRTRIRARAVANGTRAGIRVYTLKGGYVYIYTHICIYIGFPVTTNLPRHRAIYISGGIYCSDKKPITQDIQLFRLMYYCRVIAAGPATVRRTCRDFRQRQERVARCFPGCPFLLFFHCHFGHAAVAATKKIFFARNTHATGTVMPRHGWLPLRGNGECTLQVSRLP